MQNYKTLQQEWREHGIPDFAANNKIQRIVVSVPHSGTRFLRSLLKCHSVHTYLPEAFELTEVLVCPLRDPAAIWKSWERRIGTGHEVPAHHWKEAWEGLVKLDEQFDIHYVPFDTDQRDIQIARLSEILQQPLSPKWDAPLGHLPDEHCGNVKAEKDLSWIYDLPMVKQFYSPPKY